jgi:hypothetical protein
MKKDKFKKFKKIVDTANKEVEKKSKKEIEEGILDDTFSIPEKGGSPMGNGEIYVANTQDKIARQSSNATQRSSILASPGLFLGLYEDSIIGKDDYADGDLIDDTHFDNDDLVSSIENIVKIVNDDPKKLKNIYNVFVQLINNLDIEELPQEVRHKLCKKIIRKNSRLIDNG